MRYVDDQDIYWSELHPNKSQEARMFEIADVCHTAYCWTIDNLISGHFDITEDNMFDVIDKQMKPEWIDVRPDKLCPWTIARYVIRKACHDWLDCEVLRKKNAGWLAAGLKEHYDKHIYVPYSGMKAEDSVQIEKVCRVPMDHMDIPTRIHVIVVRYERGKWTAEIRAAKKV